MVDMLLAALRVAWRATAELRDLDWFAISAIAVSVITFFISLSAKYQRKSRLRELGGAAVTALAEKCRKAAGTAFIAGVLWWLCLCGYLIARTIYMEHRAIVSANEALTKESAALKKEAAAIAEKDAAEIKRLRDEIGAVKAAKSRPGPPPIVNVMAPTERPNINLTRCVREIDETARTVTFRISVTNTTKMDITSSVDIRKLSPSVAQIQTGRMVIGPGQQLVLGESGRTPFALTAEEFESFKAGKLPVQVTVGVGYPDGKEAVTKFYVLSASSAYSECTMQTNVMRMPLQQ